MISHFYRALDTLAPLARQVGTQASDREHAVRVPAGCGVADERG